jgi:hypothetical protein
MTIIGAKVLPIPLCRLKSEPENGSASQELAANTIHLNDKKGQKGLKPRQDAPL